jgi:ABC transporter related protein
MENAAKTYFKNIKKNFEWKGCINYVVVAAFAIFFSVLHSTGNLERSTRFLLEKITYSAVLAVSLCLVVGFLGELSLGHAAFMGLGAYIGGYMETYVYASFTDAAPLVSIIVSMLIGGLVAAFFGLIIGLPALRLKGDYLAIVTLAFGEIVRTVFQNSGTFGAELGMDTYRYKEIFIVGFVVLLITMFVVQNLVRSKQGRAIMAIRDNEIAARSMGINVTYYKLMVFMLSAFFAGIAGVLFSNTNRVSSGTFGYSYSIDILVMVVLGGMRSISGVIVSAVLITWINTELATVLTGNLAALQNVIYSLILIGIVVFNHAPGLKDFRKKYSFRTLAAKIFKKKSSVAPVSEPVSETVGTSSVSSAEIAAEPSLPTSVASPKSVEAEASVLPARQADAVSTAEAEAEYVLKTENLGISFGGLSAVKGIDLQIKKGELYGLIGPNGAGKTTVFNLLTGVYKPTTGDFYLNGRKLTGKSQMMINRAGIARTFQNIRIFEDMSIIRNVMVGLENRPEYKCSLANSIFRTPRYYKTVTAMREKAKELLRVFGLEEIRNQLAGNLPYGKQRKLEIARALATSPSLLLLDEPAAGMNPNETQELMDTIRLVRDKFDVTILLIEHDMRLVSGICDRLTVLNFGTVLAQGKVKDVLNDPEVVRAYLGGE